MSVGEMLAHLAVSPMWQIEVHGQNKMGQLDFAFFSAHQQRAKAEAQALRTKADIVRALRENGEKFAAFVEGLDEATLQSTVVRRLLVKRRESVPGGGPPEAARSRGPAAQERRRMPVKGHLLVAVCEPDKRRLIPCPPEEGHASR